MSEKIKQLYADAATLHGQAKAILAEFEGKEMPAEKAAEVDRLLDLVEKKTGEAKRLERVEAQDAELAQPSNERALFTPPEGAPEVKVSWGGRFLDKDEVEELKAGGPFPGFVSALSPEYAKAMRAYARKDTRQLTAQEMKDLSVGNAAAGGYLVQDVYLNTLIVKAREVSAMRQIGNVLPPVPSGSVIVPSEETLLSDAAWTTEVLTGSADAIAPFGQRRLQPHPLAKRVLVSNGLMRTPTFDVEAYVRDRMAYKFGVPAENAYINGTGVAQPLGILNSLGAAQIWTTANSNVVDSDDVINWVYALPAAYAGKPSTKILCNRAFIRKVRSMKSGLGEYVWQPGLSTGMPNQILDTPYALSDRMDDGLDASDDWEDNAVVAVIGDFSYYWIVDALQMSLQRLVELYAATNQTGFIGRMETDGMAVLAEAFYGLKIKA
jgi:HK97 family phage major capsid protein